MKNHKNKIGHPNNKAIAVREARVEKYTPLPKRERKAMKKGCKLKANQTKNMSRKNISIQKAEQQIIAAKHVKLWC